METKENTSIKLVDLYEQGDLLEISKQDALNWLLNKEPKKEWVKEHPYVKGLKYIPVGIIETLLLKLFKQIKIEIIQVVPIFNSVSVTVRLHYVHPTTGEWLFHDGVGAVELQTQAGTGALKPDFSNINRGAVMMALPAAKSFALKDAAEHLGKLFGRDLNRKEALAYNLDESSKTKLDDLLNSKK